MWASLAKNDKGSIAVVFALLVYCIVKRSLPCPRVAVNTVEEGITFACSRSKTINWNFKLSSIIYVSTLEFNIYNGVTPQLKTLLLYRHILVCIKLTLNHRFRKQNYKFLCNNCRDNKFLVSLIIHVLFTVQIVIYYILIQLSRI